MDSLPSGSRPDAGPTAVSSGTPDSERPPRRRTHGIVAAFRRIQAFVAGLLIGLSAWTPVFVATAAEETQWQQYGLPGAFALFTAGIWLRFGNFMRRRPWRRQDTGTPGVGRLAA